MIQLDTNSPETGQAASQGLRNSRSDPDGEDPIEFSQIWAEFVASETAKAAPPIAPQSPIAKQSDAGSLDTEAIDESIPALPIATAGNPSPLSPTGSDEGNPSGQFQRQLSTNRTPLQSGVRDQDSKARSPIEGAKNQTEQVSALFAKTSVQVPPSATTQAPTQTTAQKQTLSPSFTLSPQEQPRTPQSSAKPAPLAPSNTSSLAIPTLPQNELSIPMSSGALETELTVPQPLHSNGANALATVTPAQQQHAPQVASQIVAAISQSSGTTTEIFLNPEELGRVRISLTNGDAGMTVNILAERAETTDLMRRNIELLARELRDMGYENPSFTFGKRSDGSDDGWDDEHPDPAPENPSNLSDPPTPSMHVTLTGGLDLKL